MDGQHTVGHGELMDGYGSLQDAIFEASSKVHGLGEDGNEHVTLIYKTPEGRYFFPDPQTSGEEDGAKVKLAMPKGSALAALVHNHPVHAVDEKDGHDQFSSEDIDMARQLKVPSYITFGDDMQIRSYTHGKDRVKKQGSGAYRGQLSSKGAPFNHIPEVQPAGQYLARAVNALLEDAK